MLSFLADFEAVFGPLRLFRYLSFRGVMAILTALFIGFVCAPVVFAWLRKLKVNQALRTAGEVGELAALHASKQATPTMGGLLICLALCTSVLLWATPNIYVLACMGIYVCLTAVGFCDDYLKVTKQNSKGLPGRYKLLCQAIIVGVALGALWLHPVSAQGVRELWVPFVKNAVWVGMPFIAAYVLCFLVVGGASNAINLTDGIDGLAIGCTVSVALTYGVLCYITGNSVLTEYLFISYLPGVEELAVVCAALVGASLAFLWHNAYPATVFMGDTGSLALGGLIGSIAFVVHQPFTLIIIGGVFVMEALSVMAQVGSFKLTGKRIFRMAPIHHHFELGGWPEAKVVIRFWILSLLCALAGLMTLKLR